MKEIKAVLNTFVLVLEKRRNSGIWIDSLRSSKHPGYGPESFMIAVDGVIVSPALIRSNDDFHTVQC